MRGIRLNIKQYKAQAPLPCAQAMNKLRASAHRSGISDGISASCNHAAVGAQQLAPAGVINSAQSLKLAGSVLRVTVTAIKAHDKGGVREDVTHIHRAQGFVADFVRAEGEDLSEPGRVRALSPSASKALETLKLMSPLLAISALVGMPPFVFIPVQPEETHCYLCRCVGRVWVDFKSHVR